jgi:xanthine dehydrogenase YagS FAD-binding subunit
MAGIHDMMATFQLYQPTELGGALDLLRRHGSDAWILSGGMDSFDWLKDRAKSPRVVVDIGGIEELKGITATPDGGVRIGALASVTDVATHAEVTRRFPLLAQAAAKVATPQIRNQGSLGGNLSQDTRCWYYRSGWPCYRAGGNTCYASAPGALNREHAIFEANRCVAVSPSDISTALVALGAQIEIRSSRGARTVAAENFFIGPATDITRMSVLQASDILTGVVVGSTWSEKPYYFEKVSDRQSWDFALANVAAVLDMNGQTVRGARIVVGGVAARPLRMKRAEAIVTGRSIDEATLQEAGDAAVAGARPLTYNAYKVALTRNLVKRAIREAKA